MNRGLISVRYATALYSFAADKSADKTVYNEMRILLEVSDTVRELNFALNSPTLKIKDKKKVVVTAFGKPISEATSQFIDFLFEKGREDFLIQVAMKYIDLYRKKNNIHLARLVTATEPNIETEKKLLNMIEAKTGGTVEFEKLTDSSIIGGFIVDVDNLRWDASIARRIKDMKEKYSTSFNLD